MLDFSTIKDITIPEGVVARIEHNGQVLWKRELPSGFTKIKGIEFDGNVIYDSGIRLNGSDSLKFKFKSTRTCNVLGCYTATSAQTNYSLYVTYSGNYLRYNGGSYNSSYDAGVLYDVLITPTGSHGLKVESSWTEQSFVTESDFLIGTTSYGATSAKFKGYFEGNIEILGREKFIPCIRISDNEIGYYMLNEGRFLQNVGTGIPVVLEDE